MEPFYAVKCNEDERILKVMVELGMSFDCASKCEIEKILSYGVEPDRIVYANPCKQASHIRFAAESNVSLLTFDNADELHKIKASFPNAQLLLRLLPDDSRSVCRLGQKFGADLAFVPSLLRLAKNLGLNVCGASYHVGSGCYDNDAFTKAVHLAAAAFKHAKEAGMDWKILDIGGGFPGDRVAEWSELGADPAAVVFPNIAKQLNGVLNELFPAESGVRIIAEPGRYFVHSCATLAVNIIAKRAPLSCDYGEAEQCESGYSTEAYSTDTSEEEKEKVVDSIMYYVNEGVYGSFNNLIYDHAVAEPQVLISKESPTSSSPLLCSSIWGHSCDGLDCIVQDVKLPMLEVGSWLYFENMVSWTSVYLDLLFILLCIYNGL